MKHKKCEKRKVTGFPLIFILMNLVRLLVQFIHSYDYHLIVIVSLISETN